MQKKSFLMPEALRFGWSIVIAVTCLFLQACGTIPSSNIDPNRETYPVKAGELSVVLKAAQEGDVTQQVILGRMYASGTGVAKDLNQSVVWFRKAAELENARAQAFLGAGYAYGTGGLIKDINRALDLIQKSAAQNDAVGQSHLGSMYESGWGVSKDLAQAAAWFRKSAEQGNARGQAFLARLYSVGFEGFAKDDKIAAELLRKSAEQGFSVGQVNYGYLLEIGRGVVKDERAAFGWYQKAANQDNSQAQFNLGTMYLNGRGVEKNDRLAAEWIKKSADQGYAAAYNNLGFMHASGQGVVKSEHQAIEWYRKSATHGYARGQGNLASMYEKGLGGEVNIGLAYFWYLLALKTDSALAQQFDPNKATMQKLESLLTSQQRIEVQATASAWIVGGLEPVFKFKVMPAPQTAPYVAPANPTPRPSPHPAPRVTPIPAPQITPSVPSTPAPIGAAKSSGSGFRVSTTQVVTNAHVVVGCSRLRVNGLAANLQISDRQVDLALITVNGLAGTIANIRSDAVRVGEDVAVAGYPLRGLLSGFNITRGNVSSLTGLGGARWLFQITAPVQPGNSGGPLVDGAGNVAGAVVSKLSWKAAIALDDIPQNVNFAVNLGALQSFLRANSVRYQSANSGNTQMNLADVAEQAKHFTALVECL
jgi:uncharacterized protein